MNSIGDVMMHSAMLWGASEDASADLLFEEASSEKRDAQNDDSRQNIQNIEQTEFLTSSDLPITSGVDPMHAVTAIVNNEPIEGEPNFNHDDGPDGSQSVTQSIQDTIGGMSLMSSANMTEYSLPEWVMGEVANIPPSWEPLSNNPPVYTW